jgi:hypothetical protein
LKLATKAKEEGRLGRAASCFGRQIDRGEEGDFWGEKEEELPRDLVVDLSFATLATRKWPAP